jgi:hypothetical protein
VIVLIGIEIVVSLVGMYVAIKEGNQQLGILKSLDTSTSATAATLNS